MGKVTAFRAGRGRGKRVNIFLDGKFAFSLEAEVAAKEGLRLEQELGADEIEALGSSDRSQRCLNAALRFLSYRPRSEAELRERLRRRGFDSDSIEAVTAKLKEQGLLEPIPSQANFILCSAPDGQARKIKEGLAKMGIFIRYFDTQLLRNMLRISVGKPEHTDALIEALQKVGGKG